MNRRGFTLIELLVATLLFLISVFSFGYILKVGMVSVETASRLNNGLFVLQAKAEEIHALPFTSLISLNGKTFANGKGKIKVVSALADLSKVDLELTWDTSKSPIKFTTLRSSY